MSAVPTPGQPGPVLSSVRQMRVELLASMAAVSRALAAPAVGREDAWVAGVDFALVELSEDVREHVTTTEAPGGLHQDVVQTAPRLTHAVDRLSAEHADLSEALAELLAQTASLDSVDSVEQIRDRATGLLATIARHQQRGADLIYEAYQSDIGGET
jgi:ElaB/YqjD/DUF883 family membrane-anchored ribosome-binding protein